MNEFDNSEINQYMHCKKCLDELPKGVAPKEWSKVAIIKIRNFETLHTDAQLYIDSVQEKDMLIVDRDGGTEFGY